MRVGLKSPGEAPTVEPLVAVLVWERKKKKGARRNPPSGDVMTRVGSGFTVDQKGTNANPSDKWIDTWRAGVRI